MDLEIFTTRGLGDSTYLVAAGREAVLVDPQRDAWRFLEVAERRGWRVTHVLETHVHNDYVSGAVEARAATGAEIVAPARGGYGFAHRGVVDGDAVELEGLGLVAIATPGHTPEHLAWAVVEGAPTSGSPDVPSAVFTGGSLLVGAAGRTDLLGDTAEPALSADQAGSLRRLATLPPGVRILPTHGAGSFCSAGPSAPRSVSTLAEERATNPMLTAAVAGDGAFRDRLVASLGQYPAYYAHMAVINRAGPAILGGLTLPAALDPVAFERARQAGAVVVDARDREAFAAAHLPGALNVELDDTFAAYVGWLVPFGAPILLILPEPAGAAVEEATTQLLRIGYEGVRGSLAGGLEAWVEERRPIESYPTQSVRRLDPDAETTILDVRQPIEWRDDGMIPGSIGIFVADLPARLAELRRDRPVTVVCKSGSRAAIAASILDAAGFDVRLVSRGGVPSWRGPLAPPASPPIGAD